MSSSSLSCAAAPMAPPLLPLLCLLFLTSAAARDVLVEYLYPPFNLTYFNFIDTSGVFLLSSNATFSAAIYNAGADFSDQQSRYFFSVLHHASRTPVWTAAATFTVLQPIVLCLSRSGLALSDPADHAAAAWSTPRLPAPVAALRLLDTGELALLDADNATLWSSLARPADTLLPAQTLRAGVPLTSTISAQNLSPGTYRLLLTSTDALLQWAASPEASFLTYWSLSSDAAAVRDSNGAVHSMAVNASGLYLLAANDRDTVVRLLFPSLPPEGASCLVKVDPFGRLRVLNMAGYSPAVARASLPTVWSAPPDDCSLPLRCGPLGLCTPGTNGSSSCLCPDAFRFSTYNNGGCSPADGSLLPESCVGTGNAAPAYSYMSLGDGIGYFADKFAAPATSGNALPACRNLCSANCSCLGFFYRNSSKSCFLLHDSIGSVFRGGTGTDVAAGFIRTITQDHGAGSGGGSRSSLSCITIVFGIVLPTVAAVFIAIAMGVQWLRRRQLQGNKGAKRHGSGHRSWFRLTMLSSRASSNAPSTAGEGEEEEENDQADEVLIPGLPARFTFADLDAATNGFKSPIGSGGFGSVYRGVLPDGSTVAVKRMSSLGAQGRREFLTEIAVIGDVHHVNLVRLRGFCAEGAGRRLLVYEYMNRGSLDQCLFRGGAGAASAALEWPDRLRVCVGAARGLAYLHAGCDRKILHCDVKPENILLDDRGGVKIADFGLAKLMSPEQSGLFTTMRGTRGYLAPEWLADAPITDKADVYSFGMVLLEIVRGRKNSHSWSGTGAQSDGGVDFPAMALELHEQGRYEELLDPRLEGRAPAVEVSRVVRVALCSLHKEAAQRPGMTAVSGMLDGSMDVGAPRPELLGYLGCTASGWWTPG